VTPKGKPLSRFGAFLRNAGRSHLGWLLACLHAAWFLLSIANMSPPSPGFGRFLDHVGGSSATLLAGRPFHFAYESLFLKLLILADMPSTLAMVPMSLVLFVCLKPLHLGFYFASYLTAALVLVGATCQLLVVGSYVERWLALRVWGSWLRLHIHRWSSLIIAIIVIATLVLAPVVNERSRSLGFRHGGISFR